MFAVPEPRLAPASSPSAKEATRRPTSSTLWGGSGCGCQDPSQQGCRQKDRARVSRNIQVLSRLPLAGTRHKIPLLNGSLMGSPAVSVLSRLWSADVRFYFLVFAEAEQGLNLAAKAKHDNAGHFQVSHKGPPFKKWGETHLGQCSSALHPHKTSRGVNRPLVLPPALPPAPPKWLEISVVFFLLHRKKKEKGFIFQSSLRPCGHAAAIPRDAPRAARSAESGTMCEAQLWSTTSRAE